MAGWFDFVNGQTLPASRVQDYLMDQSVMVFANAAAREAALPLPTSGMVSYLVDQDRLYVAQSFQWRQIIDTDNLPAQSATLPTRRNLLVNGGMDIFQRGTSFTNPNGLYTADRYITFYDGSGATRTWSRQTFTPNQIPGQDSQFYLRLNQSVAGTGGTYSLFGNRSEDVRESANRTMTYSFWAKAAAATSVSVYFVQNFGSGGSSEVGTGATTFNLTTSWQRFTVTLVMPSISGKTVGAGSYVDVRWNLPLNTTYTIDTWGWQFEQGSVATPFARAATTLQGELAACQRYYYRSAPGTLYGVHANGHAFSTTQMGFYLKLPITMRAVPTSVESSTASSLCLYDGTSRTALSAGATIDTSFCTPDMGYANVAVASGLTATRTYAIQNNNSATAFVAFSAEL
jgi:hypothetical protein